MKDAEYLGVPDIPIPMGGSDQKPFLDYLGEFIVRVPSVNFAWIDMDKHHTYPLYHTLYETPFASEHLMDVDNFAIHRAIGQYWIELAVRFADAPTIPYSLSTLSMRIQRDYIPALADSIQSLNMTSYTTSGYNQLREMAKVAANLTTVTVNLESQELPRNIDQLWRSRYNDRLIKYDTRGFDRGLCELCITQDFSSFERCFVNPRGIPDDAAARHVLFSTSKTDSYSGEVMQQVYKVLDDMVDAQTKIPAALIGLIKKFEFHPYPPYLGSTFSIGTSSHRLEQYRGFLDEISGIFPTP
ncbi:hypothetical protein NECAME_11667 [Necator americanus]|uniref:Uncharacterized protein n=1 Tax=Necator americanus TaxID=51031 RepID=W2T3F4_NECAM|nr:hypothetical protein NECAME_11667 [Necator americanus]ETN76428.1 hypothetical protein NECAME_11667 [Necator americanus]